jgi:WD40 repeat protein
VLFDATAHCKDYTKESLMDPEKVESRAEAAAAGAEGAEPFAVSDEALPGDDEGDDEPLAHPICAATFDDPVYAVSAHPTAPIIAAGHGGDGVCVWDARTGQLLMQADKVHSDSVTTVGFSRDGKYLASASLDHSLRVWKVRQTPPVLPAVAAAVASADGPAAAASSSVAVAAGDASRTTWEIVSGLRRKKKGKKRATKAQAGSKSTPKGNTTTEEPDSSLKLGYPEPLVLEGPSEDVEWMAWHPTGPALLCGSADCTAWLYDVSSGECLSVLAGHEGAVTAGTFDGKGKLAVTASDDGSLRVWAPGTGECKLVVRGGGWFPPGEPVVSIVAHQSKPIVLAGGVDGTARLVNISTGKVLGKLDHSLAAGKVLEAAAAKQAADQAAAIDRAMTRLAEAKAAGDEDVEIDLMAEMDAAKAEPPTASEATAATSGSGGDDSASATGALQGAATAAAQEEEEEEEEEGLPSIEGVGFCTLEGMQLAATGGSDGSLRVWDLSTFRPRAAC